MKSQTSRGGKPHSFSGASGNNHAATGGGWSAQRKNAGKTGSGSGSVSAPAAAAEAHNRLVSLLAHATGKNVLATVSSGARYRGVLLALNLGLSGEDALSVVLVKPTLAAKAVINEKSNVDGKLPSKLVIEAKDLIDIEIVHANEVTEPVVSKEKSPERVSEQAPEPQPGTTTETTIPAFKTDRDIAAGYQFKERELQRWVPDEDTPELTLESGSTGTWDQFKVNEERFGVESSYDEHLYTTKINTQAKDYQDRLRRAERLAREIEGLASSDQHVLEERGVVVDDSGLDEEDKYSGVIQDNVGGAPAPARAPVPVDTRGNELMAALRNASISNESVQVLLGEGKYTTPRQRAARYHNDPAIVSSSATRKVADGDAKDTKDVKPSPASIPPKPLMAQELQEPRGEAFRLNAESEFNALREFSANFKIPHKIPNDLLPILAKDKLKQDEILRKQEKSKTSDKPDPASAPAPPTASSSTTAVKPAATLATLAAPGAKKEGSKFKLNPKAAAFTPSKPLHMSPVPSKAHFSKSSNNSSPRLHHQRPYSNSSSSGSGTRRHYQISAADFFGGADKVPTVKSQREKSTAFKTSFNMFATAVRKHAGQSTPLVLEKAFKTPPTWDSNVDESYEEIIGRKSGSASLQLSPGPTPPFITSPVMPVANGVPPMMAGGYMGAAGAGGKFAISPHLQQPMAAQFQQPFHPSMGYPQFQGGVPPGQPQVMYAPPGVDPLLFPPGGFMVPGYMGSPAPVNGGASFQGVPPHHSGQGYHHGGRRYNQNKRAGGNER